MRVVDQQWTWTRAFAAAISRTTVLACAAACLGQVAAGRAGSQDSGWERVRRAEVLAERSVAPGSHLAVRRYGIDEGLPSLALRALEYGPDGDLWIGTLGGLCSFDGVGFEVLPRSGQGDLPSGRIDALHRDARGRMWVGTHGAGAFVFEAGRFRRAVSIDEVPRSRLVTSTVDGDVWIGGVGAAVVVDDVVRVLDLGAVAGDAPPYVHGIDVLADGRVRIDASSGTWIGTAAGLARVEGPVVSSRFVDPGGRPCERRAALGWFDSETGEALPVQPPFQRVIDTWTRADGAVVVAARSGLHVLRGSGITLRIEAPEATSRVNSIERIGARGLFIGTQDDGLISAAKQPFLVTSMPGASARSVSDLAVDERGRVFVASNLQRRSWTGDGRAFEADASAAGGLVRDVVARGGGGFFVLRRDGLQIVADGAVTPIGPPFTSLRSDGPRRRGAPRLLDAPGGGAWLWAGGTIVEFAPDGRELRRLPDACPQPSGAIASAAGTVLLVGSEVLRIGPTDEGLEVVLDLPARQLRAAALDEDGALWVTTYGDGLFRRRADGTVDHWTRQDGLIDDFLGWVGVAPDAEGVDRLWVNSNSGVLAIDLASLESTLESPRAKLATWRLGTPESNGAEGAVAADGALLLPSLEGLVRVDPARTAPPAELLVRVGVVTIDGEPYGTGDALAGANLEVRFHGVAFPTAEGAVYEYRLRGLEDSWVPAGESRVARYPDLRAGDYVFEVRGRTRHGEWSAPAAALGGEPLHVAKLWHQRPGVRGAAIACAVLLLVGAIRLRTRSLRTRADWMEREIERRRRVEDELARNEMRFRTLFRTIPTPVLVWDGSLALVDWNDSAGRTLGLASTRDRSHRLSDLVVEGVDGAEFLRVAEAATARAQRVFARCRVQSRAGEERHFRWALGPLHEGEGPARAIIALGADVTDEERTAADLDQLRRRVVRAEEVERGRIARELHDDLSQRLAALAMDLARVTRRHGTAEDVDADAMVALARVEDGVREVARDAHSLSRQLHPTVLDDLGLARAIQSEAERRARQHQVKINVHDDLGGETSDRDVALTVFRVAQEALQNACRHARASSIDVRLSRCHDGGVSLVVEDDGVGFDAAGARERGATGIGLASMSERARLVGGSLRVHSRPGAGTEVELIVPL